MISPSLHPAPIRAAFEPRSRWAYGLTPRSVALLCAGFLGLIPGFWDPHLAYSMLAWDFLVLVFTVLDAFRLPAARDLIATRTWSNAPALDSETEIELTIENRGKLIIDCRLVDDLPEALLDHPSTHRLTAFPRVPASLRYRVQPQERGDWTTGWLFLRYRSGLGLSERWARAPLTQQVRIYPALRTGEEQQIFLARSRQIDLQLRQARLRGLGRDFESLREYREGDDLRDICWTATARRGGLITRQYQTERSQAVWIVLDCGRLMRSRVAIPSSATPSKSNSTVTGLDRGPSGRRAENAAKTRGALAPAETNAGPRDGDPPQPHSKLDYACTTAVALAQLALFSGDRVGLLAYGQSIQQRLLPGRGAAHLRQLIESLALVRAETGEADHLRATATLNRLQPRRALILWITDLAETAMRPEVIDGATQLLRRHVLLFVAMAQPEVESIAQTRPKTVDQMFRAAAAQEMAARRELLLARLHEHGALTLDLNPEALTSSVLNQYLTVKERAMV
ncbi:MAG TPA: DUF58 domain-containing protein [Terracidiphilus sp.]|jgi:uncharacterized protein (DUF58 family)|nr:DUF58 domain-containing protein [Terracidiphilus sp.]